MFQSEKNTYKDQFSKCIRILYCKMFFSSVWIKFNCCHNPLPNRLSVVLLLLSSPCELESSAQVRIKNPERQGIMMLGNWTGISKALLARQIDRKKGAGTEKANSILV